MSFNMNISESLQCHVLQIRIFDIDFIVENWNCSFPVYKISELFSNWNAIAALFEIFVFDFCPNYWPQYPGPPFTVDQRKCRLWVVPRVSLRALDWLASPTDGCHRLIGQLYDIANELSVYNDAIRLV